MTPHHIKLGITILVCGGRDYWDALTVFGVLDKIHEKKPIHRIVQGGAKGADTLAKVWALLQPDVKMEEYPANWKKYGKAAGGIRNGEMLDKEDIKGVIAFPGGYGTADMIRKAKALNIKVMEIE